MSNMHWTSVLLWAGALAPGASALPWKHRNEGNTPGSTMNLCGRELAEAFTMVCNDEWAYYYDWVPEQETKQPSTTHTPPHETTTQDSQNYYESAAVTSWNKPSSWEEPDSWDKPSSWEEIDSWDKPSSWEEPDYLKKPDSQQKIYRRSRRYSIVLKARSKRGLVSECCLKACTLEELRSLC